MRKFFQSVEECEHYLDKCITMTSQVDDELRDFFAKHLSKAEIEKLVIGFDLESLFFKDGKSLPYQLALVIMDDLNATLDRAERVELPLMKLPVYLCFKNRKFRDKVLDLLSKNVCKYYQGEY